jgi:hypothetical protein
MTRNENTSTPLFSFFLLYHIILAMLAEWTDFFYGKQPPVTLQLSDSNWCKWNTNVLNYLQPYDGAVRILQGKIDTRITPLSDVTIDTELFFFLLKSLDRQLFTIAMDARARHGLSGSRLYRILKGHFASEVEESKAPLINHIKRPSPGFEIVIPKKERSERSKLSVPKKEREEQVRHVLPKKEGSEQVEPAGKNGIKKRCFKSDGDTSSTTSNKRRKIELEDCLRYATAVMKNVRTLTIERWPEWDATLRKALCESSFADGQYINELLGGLITENDPSYLSALDETLFSIIEKGNIKPYYAKICLASLEEHGRKGSKLYLALKKHMHSQKRRYLSPEISRFGLRHTLVDLMALLKETSIEYDMKFTRKDIEHYIEEVRSKFKPQNVEDLLRHSEECDSLYQYYKRL